MSDLRSLVEVWRTTCEDLTALAKELDDASWALPTDLPGWSVHDVFAHCSALEVELTGEPVLRVEIDKQAPHIKNPAGIYTERGVAARRSWSASELIAEFDGAVERRTAMLAAEPLDDPEGAPPVTPGKIGWNWATLLSTRPVDIWTHEQDIRRAVGKPGHLNTPGARHTQQMFASRLPYVVAKRAEAPPGTAVIIDVTGPVSATYALSVNESGRGIEVDPSSIDAVVTLTMDTESFTMLSAGRREPSHLPIKIDGDHALAARLLAAFTVTL